MRPTFGPPRQHHREDAKTDHPTGGIIAVESLAGEQLATFVGVTVTLRDLDSGEEDAVRSRYVIAADGNRSPMRTRLGIGMNGHGILSRSITIYFRADCTPLLQDRNEGVIYVHNPELRGYFRIDRAGKSGFLVINTVGADVTTDEAVNVGEGIYRGERGSDAADGDRHAGHPCSSLATPPARGSSTPMTPSAAHSRNSLSSRRTRATPRGSYQSAATTTRSRSSTT